MLQANQSDLPLAEYVKRQRQKDMAQRKVHGLLLQLMFMIGIKL